MSERGRRLRCHAMQDAILATLRDGLNRDKLEYIIEVHGFGWIECKQCEHPIKWHLRGKECVKCDCIISDLGSGAYE